MKEDTLSGIVVIGSQWEMKVKGKVVDVLVPNRTMSYDTRAEPMPVTPNREWKKTVLHLVPSGVFTRYH